jgi:hypothetical protein
VSNDILLNTIYEPSDDVVVREIEGELIIVPLVSGIGDMEDDLFSLNETGRAIWDKLGGVKTVEDVITELTGEFDASKDEIEKDVTGFLAELMRRKMIRTVG